MKETDMTKPTAKPGLSANPEDQGVFEKGCHAAKHGIRREDSPYTGALADVWLDGWDYAANQPGGRVWLEKHRTGVTEPAATAPKKGKAKK